jgi:hypothetical protein
MAKPRAWVVAKNEPVKKLESNLWIVHGETPGLPMPLPRTMAVARLDDGRLVIHSAICLDEDAMRELEAWGTPAFLVLPNGWHRIDAHAWKQRYPSIQVLCPRNVTKQVGAVVSVDGETEGFPAEGAVRFEILEGNGKESVMIVSSGGKKTLVFGDTFINAPHMPGLPAFFYRMLGASGGPRVHPFMKWMSKKKPLRGHLAKLAETDGLARLVPGHGAVIETDALGVFRTAVAGM